MKAFFTIIVTGLLASSIAGAGSKVRWPKDAVEIEKVAEAKEVAVEKEKGLAFIFVPSEWPDDEDGSVARSIDMTNDAIKGLKSYCVIVKGGDLQVFMQGMQQEQDPGLRMLAESISKAGMSYPLVVALDAEMKNLLVATSGQNLSKDGKKILREGKKKLRDLEKAAEEKDKDKK